uniref:Uncharacterized protein LOC113794854 n=1 Tax=Dermatophagoides pteronyssinus TaxID=6956 RepID=A0A6P6Y715_DERPT|nr:uncharacterized protein LOC113794854 [Dermatophagoides pteronyssinus]
MHRRSKARISTNNNRRMSGTTATTSNHKSNQRKIHDDKFAIQKKCISIDMKVDEIDMSAYDANTLDDLNKHRLELNEQNILYKELVQTIFTQKNVEKPLIAIVQQLGEKIKQYDDKISKKFQSLKQNGIPIDSKQSSSSSSTTTTTTSTSSSTSQRRPLLSKPTTNSNDDEQSSIANMKINQNCSNIRSSSGPESRSPSPSLPPPPSKDKSSCSKYFAHPKSNRNENVDPSNRRNRRNDNFSEQKQLSFQSNSMKTSNLHKSNNGINKLEQVLKNKNNFVGVDSNFDDDDFNSNVRLANGGDLIFDDNPDPTAVEPCVANPETDWVMNMKNFIHQYYQLPAHRFIDQFRRSRSQKLLYLSLDDRIELFNSMLDDLASNYPDEHDQLIVPFIKIAEIIRISRPQLHIMEWARDKIFAGLYGDIVNYRDLPQQIDQCQDEVIKSTLIESFEMKKSESLKCYRGTLNIIGTMYNKSISRPNKDIHEIFRYLSKQSTKQNCEIYLELLTDFILLVGPKFLSSSSNDKNRLTITQMDEILMKFKHSSSSSSSNDDYLESKRSMVINLIEKQMKLMIRNPNNL